MKSVENYRVLDIFYVARQPIFKNSGEIWGYELLYRSGSNQQAAEISNEDIATLCVATCGFVLSQEYTDKTKKICINFTEKLILEGAPRGLPPSRTVVDILENVRPTAEVMKILEQLRKEGYTIAIDGFEGNGDRNKLLDIADIVKIDIHGKTMNEIENAFLILKTNKALKMAKKVDNRETLRPLRRMGCDLYQGNFFAKPINLRGRTLKPAEISKLRILQALEDPSLTPEKINEVIATDPSLTYRLLRLLNSAAFEFLVKIESVRHAINLIGLNRLKYWLRMVIMSDLSRRHKTPEIYVMSLNRGRFLEELSRKDQIKIAPPETMFLFGMLSLIEPMLEAPMEDILDELPLTDAIKSGYTDRDSTYGKYLQLVVAVEYADPKRIQRLCDELGVLKKEVAAASNQAVTWTNTIYQSMP